METTMQSRIAGSLYMPATKTSCREKRSQQSHTSCHQGPKQAHRECVHDHDSQRADRAVQELHEKLVTSKM